MEDGGWGGGEVGRGVIGSAITGEALQRWSLCRAAESCSPGEDPAPLHSSRARRGESIISIDVSICPSNSRSE